MATPRPAVNLVTLRRKPSRPRAFVSTHSTAKVAASSHPTRSVSRLTASNSATRPPASSSDRTRNTVSESARRDLSARRFSRSSSRRNSGPYHFLVDDARCGSRALPRLRRRQRRGRSRQRTSRRPARRQDRGTPSPSTYWIVGSLSGLEVVVAQGAQQAAARACRGSSTDITIGCSARVSKARRTAAAGVRDASTTSSTCPTCPASTTASLVTSSGGASKTTMRCGPVARRCSKRCIAAPASRSVVSASGAPAGNSARSSTSVPSATSPSCSEGRCSRSSSPASALTPSRGRQLRMHNVCALTSSTRWSISAARLSARLIAQYVFPSPGSGAGSLTIKCRRCDDACGIRMLASSGRFMRRNCFWPGSIACSAQRAHPPPATAPGRAPPSVAEDRRPRRVPRCPGPHPHGGHLRAGAPGPGRLSCSSRCTAS